MSMTQTGSLVHVNISLVLTVHLRWSTWLRLKGHHLVRLHHPSSEEPFDGLCELLSFRVALKSFHQLKGHHWRSAHLILIES